MRKYLLVGLMLSLLFPILAACNFGGDSGSAERRVLRIGTLYGSSNDESWFRQQYTDSYDLLRGNIDIEIVHAIDWNNQRFQNPTGKPEDQPDPYEELKKMLTGQNPVDVVVVEYSQLKRMVEDNLLAQLDPLIQKDKLDLSDYAPAVLDGIKSMGDNNIFALTPTFSSSALYYNKKIFSDAGVEMPQDNMSWQEVFALAERVANGEGKDRKYGFNFNRWGSDPFYDAQNYASPLQLKIFDDKGEKMLVNSGQWEKVWTDIHRLYNNKVAPKMEDIYAHQEPYDPERPHNPYEGDLFISGRVAMTLSEYGYINEIITANDNAGADNMKNFQPLDWDVVTVPTFEEVPGVGGNIYLSSLMAINSKAQNPDDAWDYIKFLNSKEWAKLKSRSMWEMPARMEFLQPKNGLSYNIEAFTKIKPIAMSSNDAIEKLYRERPNLWQVQQIGQELFHQVMSDTKSVKEALAEWETRGDALLQEMKNNPNASMYDEMPIDGKPLPIDGGVGIGVYEDNLIQETIEAVEE